MFDLTGKIALVTGASRGMGAAHAKTLAKQGATVIVTGTTKESCDPIVKEITEKGGHAVAYKLDVTNKKDIHSVITKVVKKFGRLDILVNNAGIFQEKPALEMTEKDWDQTITVNLKGEFLVAQRAAKEMAKNTWGRIINIASIASGQVGVGIAGGAHYAASKGGIIAMTETLAIELAPLGILVNAIAPGAIDTPMLQASELSKKEKAGFLAGIPLKRFGRSEEVSAAVVFLASEEASYVTGSTVYVDGGWLAT